jgi:hypothetical protein
MLWYKAWLETRWRFLIGLAVLMLLAVGSLFNYRAVMDLLPLVRTEVSGPLGKTISDAVEVQSTYRGYVWWQWVRQNLTQMWTLFAVLLASGGLLSKASGGAALFTLSLPASRNRLLAVRAATVLAELLVLAFVPSLLFPLFSPAIGQSYSVADALIHSACLFIGGIVLFSLTFLLSTIFDDLWRPLLIACAIAVVLAIGEQTTRGLAPYGLFRVMSGEPYFRAGEVPWIGLVVSAAASIALLSGAAMNFARRDF